MADMAANRRGYADDFDPHRSPPPPPLVPHSSAYVSPSIRVLSEMYNFPSMPEPPPIFDDNVSSSSSSDSGTVNNYQSGVMMASRRLKEALSPERPKRSIYATNNLPPEPRKPIPGWTDGSNAWRPALYSLSAPMDLTKMDPDQLEKATVAYRSCVASPHRSQYVYSTLTDTSRTDAAYQPGGMAPQSSLGSDAEQLYSKYSESLSRRSESRTSLFHSGSPTSPHSPTHSQRRERPLVPPGAEGKLLVPNVKMRVNGGSSASLPIPWCASFPGSSRRGSSSTKDSDSREDFKASCASPTSSPRPKRPTVESESSTFPT
jgi:hypothetical protein